MERINRNIVESGEQIAILGKGTDSKGRFPGKKETISSFDFVDPNIKKSEYNDLLSLARKSLLENEDLLKRFVDAIRLKDLGNSVKSLAEIENEIVEYCINLTDIDIENVIRQLNDRFRKYIFTNASILDISGNVLDQIRTGRLAIDTKGIVSVVSFIRTRCKLLMSNPANKFTMGFNVNFDAKYRVDILELIFDGDDQIDQLNLIQVKSSRPDEEEIRNILNDHKNLITRDILKMGEIEEYEFPPDTEKEIFESTLVDQELMFDNIFSLYTDYHSIENSRLIQMLGIEKLTILQQAWIIDNYFKEIKEVTEFSLKEGYIEQNISDIFVADLDRLRKSLLSKSGIPRKIIQIKSANSLIAVGSSVIRDVNILNLPERKDLPVATIG